MDDVTRSFTTRNSRQAVTSRTSEETTDASTLSRLKETGRKYNFRRITPSATVMTLTEFVESGRRNALDLEALREERILALEAIELIRLAQRLRNCLRGWTCNRRTLCPECGKKDSTAKRWMAKAQIKRMRHPVALTISCFSPIDDLTAAATQLVKWLATLRKRRAFKKLVAGGVGGLELKQANERPGWAVHIHLVLDAHLADEAKDEIAQLWRQITGGYGKALWDSEGAKRATATQLAEYLTKPDCWSWQRLHGRALAVYVRAAHHRRHLVAWGTGRPRSGLKRPRGKR